jgi:hypothetical protein
MRISTVVTCAWVIGFALPARASVVASWARAFPQADGTEVFLARDGGGLVIAVAEFGATNCSANVDPIDPIDVADDLAVQSTDTRPRTGKCFRVGALWLRIWRVGSSSAPVSDPSLWTSVRPLVQTLAGSHTRDASSPMPAGWVHYPTPSDPGLVGALPDIAYIDDAVTVPPCDGVPGHPPISTAVPDCLRRPEVPREHRRQHGQIIVSLLPSQDVAAPSQTTTDLIAWLAALDPGARALTPFAVEPLLPPTRAGAAMPSTPAATTAAAPVAAVAAVPDPSAYEPSPTSEPYRPPSHALQYLLIDIHPVRYEVMARDSWVGPAIWLATPDHKGQGHGAFVRAQAFGGKIIEHGGGPISKINAFLVNVGGGLNGDRYYNSQTGERWRDVGPEVTGGREASWSFDVSDAYWSFRADSWLDKYFGWRLGAWNLRQLDGRTRYMLDDTSASAKLLDAAGGDRASFIQNSGGFEIEILLRLPLRVPLVGVFAAEVDLPIIYTIAEPFVALGMFDESLTGSLGSYGGIPRMNATFHRMLGPITMHVNASLPSRFLIIPWDRDGAQLTLGAGLAY